MTEFTDRELEQIRACTNYARDTPSAGLPMHTLLILVAKLAEALRQSKAPETLR